ncbi:MAG: two-component regulator propeller domain-containing protein [Bacteroidota bacterium]|nr:two-component regulator propeller domain-containing protein [Bacteroidota bacterium]
MRFFAQNQDLQFEHVSIENGLSQSAVFSIIQDKQGFMWFGTQDGLNMYDGYKFTIYRNSIKDSNSISTNYIRCIIDDKNGNLWIGTWGAGLNLLNKVTGKFTRFRYQSENPGSLSSDFVSALMEDKEGNIWVATDGGGLNKIDPVTKKIKRYARQSQNQKGISSNRLSCLIQDKTGNIWIGTKGYGLNRFDPKTEDFTVFLNDPQNKNSISQNWIASFCIDHKNDLLIATETCIEKYDPAKQQFIHYSISLKPLAISALQEDKNQLLWISTFGEGLFSLNTKTNSVNLYTHDPRLSESLGLDNIPSMMFDKGGVLWLGTYGEGIDKVNLYNSKFKLYRNTPGNPQSLKSKSIRAIFEDKDQLLYIGGYGGIDVIDRKNNKNMSLVTRINNSLGEFNSSNVYQFLEDADDSNILWIAHEGKGISKYNLSTKSIINFQNTSTEFPYGMCSNFFFSTFDDGNGTIWFGGLHGLSKFDKKTEKFQCFKNDPENTNSLSNNDIKVIHKGENGKIWIGTTGGGLDLFDPKTNIFIHHTYEENDTNCLSSNSVRCIHEDSNGILWIGTDGGGLNRYDPRKNTFKMYSEDDGLPNNTVYGILPDEKGNFWMSTNFGLCRFDPKNETFKTFDLKDGLQSNEFNQGACFKSKSGEMFFGGINGLNSFYPKNIRDNPHQPPIVITSFKKANAEVIFDRPINLLNEIKLTHLDQIVSFEFAALDFTSPEKNQYAYKLEGFNKDWTYSGTKHEATYTNLDPGEYIFSVKGSNNDGVWNEAGTSIKIIIAPPYWKTIWFRTLIIISVIAIVILIFKIRIKRIKKQNLELESQVRERTIELSEINQQLEKLSIVASETANGVFITDSQGNVEWFNEGYTKLLGWESVEEYKRIKGKHVLEVSGHNNIADIIREAVEKKKSVSYESINISKQGKKLWLQTTLTPIFDIEGKLKHLVFVDTDVTELKQAKETAEQALHIQEQFLANTSHEIRTPMNGVLGMTRQLLETPLNKEQVEYLNAIKESSNNLLHVVNDILDISKIRAGKVVFEKTEFRLTDIFKTLRFTLQYKVEEKNIYLKTVIDEQLPQVLIGDPVRLNQIILNLTGNAIKFTDEGGVTVSANFLHYEKDKIVVQFSIKDTGIGIPEDKLNFVFETFAQAESHTTRKYGGTGLGLSISKSLVQQQGGTIEVKSKINEGSVFYFNLPFGIGNPDWQGSIIHPHDDFNVETDLSNLNILLVEDNKINQRVALFELHKWNIKTDVANEPKEAFGKLSKNKYDIILMDISMPGMDGIEATRYIRKHMPEPVKSIPIIAMTASALAGEKERCLEAGMDDYISKPFNPSTLYSKIVKWADSSILKSAKDPHEVSILNKKKKVHDLSKLRESADGDIDYVKEMIEIYINDMPVYLSELNKALSDNNFQEVLFHAHKMKSPAALFGVYKLNETLLAIETRVHNRVEIDKDLVLILNEISNQSFEELRIELDNLKMG